MTIHLVGEKFGDYRLLRLIGRGGFADVYLGEHFRRKTLAAVKVLNTRLANDNVKSFLNEARSIRLRHPHIVQILDFGLEDDFPFLVMEYAPNGSLRQRYPRGTRLTLKTISIYVKQIADALQYAHDDGIVHRDIKPDNMLLGRQKEILLSDFGIASIAHTTRSMHIEDQAGTINYMAPEQLQGKPRSASDQYALGVVVYEWICGERPFQGSFVEIHGQHLSAHPPSLRERVPTVSTAVEKVVVTSLAKDPHSRFATILEFAEAFEQASKSVSSGRQMNRRVFTPQSPLSEVFADLPVNNPPMHAATKPNERSPTAPKLGFRSDVNRPPSAHPKNSVYVPARASLSLPEARSRTYTTKHVAILNDAKRVISVLRKRGKTWPITFFIIIVVMLIAGLAIALPGGSGFFVRFIPGIATTSIVTITPKSIHLANTFEILTLTGTPDPNMHEIAEHIITATSLTQTKTVTLTGRSFPGARATGALTFLTSGSTKSFGRVILRGASGVPVTFNGPITVSALPGFLTVTGYAVNIGSAGNIGALDISGSCCAAGITVKSGAFSGGQDPQPYSIVQQSDIDGAANALAALLTPGTKTSLKGQVKSGEQVVPNTLQCNQSTFTTNHAAGDHAPDVTVAVAITCKEGVYDQQAAQTMAANLLKAQVNKDLGPNYALTGNVVAGVTKVSVIDTRETVALLVRAEGVWVYQFSDAVKQNFAKHIANVSKQNAFRYLMSQPGVSNIQIDFSSSNTLPDVAYITFELKPVQGAAGFGGDNTTASGSPVVPIRIVNPPISPTPTQGLGGS
jgi:serine/threonine protein kinase